MYKINKTCIEGCMELNPDIFSDHRGLSIKPYHIDTFKDLGIKFEVKEELVVTSKKDVIRGLHFQKHPFEQAKLIYCAKGSILDVAVDLRKGSSTYGKYVCIKVDEKKHNIIFIPSGFAHGYLVLQDDTMVVYKMSSVYAPQSEGGIRWDSLDIPWNINNPIISDKDKKWPLFKDIKGISKFEI